MMIGIRSVGLSRLSRGCLSLSEEEEEEEEEEGRRIAGVAAAVGPDEDDDVVAEDGAEVRADDMD